MLGANLPLRIALEFATLNRRFEMEILIKPQYSLFTLLFAMLIVLMIAPSSLAGSASTPTNSSKSNVHSGETLTGKATYYPNRLNGTELPVAGRFVRMATLRHRTSCLLGPALR
jgi:hypothetical protein